MPAELPTPIDHGGQHLALNVYLSQYGDDGVEQVLAQIKALGIDTIKQPFYFTEDFDWQASDSLVAAAVAQDLTLVPLLDGDPPTNLLHRVIPRFSPIGLLSLPPATGRPSVPTSYGMNPISPVTGAGNR